MCVIIFLPLELCPTKTGINADYLLPSPILPSHHAVSVTLLPIYSFWNCHKLKSGNFVVSTAGKICPNKVELYSNEISLSKTTAYGSSNISGTSQYQSHDYSWCIGHATNAEQKVF